jgi:uncharacterized membrane protein
MTDIAATLRKAASAFANPLIFFLVFASVLQCIYISHFFVLRDYYHGAQRFFHVAHLANTVLGKPDTLPVSFLELLKSTAPYKMGDVEAMPCSHWALAFRIRYCVVHAPVLSMPPLSDLMAIKLNPYQTFLFMSNAAASHYSIIGYIPYVLPLAAGLWLNLPPILLVYAAVGFNAILMILLGTYTLRILPILRWPACFILLLPSSFMNRSFVMPDALTMELSFLVLGVSLHYKCFPRLLEKRHFIILIVLAILIGAIKIAYFFIPLIYLIIPSHCFNNQQRRLVFIMVAFVSSIAAAMAWNYYATMAYYAPLFPGRLQSILSSPFAYIRTIYQSLAVPQIFWMNLENMLMWNRLSPYGHGLMVLLALPLLLLTIIETSAAPNLLRIEERLLGVDIFLLLWGMVLTAMYLHVIVTPEQLVYIPLTMQGRYFIPALPFLLLAFHSIMHVPKKWFYIVKSLLCCSMVASLAYLNYCQLYKSVPMF